LETFVRCSESEDGGRFILCGNSEIKTLSAIKRRKEELADSAAKASEYQLCSSLPQTFISNSQLNPVLNSKSVKGEVGD